MLFVKRQVFHLEGTTSYPKTMPQGTVAGSLHYPTHTGFSSGLQQIIGAESVDTKCVVRRYVNAAKMSDGVYSPDSRSAVFPTRRSGKPGSQPRLQSPGCPRQAVSRPSSNPFSKCR